MTAIILGPMSCQGCHARVYLTVDRRLVNADRETRHACPPPSTEPPDEYRTCADCGRTYLLEDFPLSNPRVDGTVTYMRYCDECYYDRRFSSPEERAAIQRMSHREAMQRRRERARQARKSA